MLIAISGPSGSGKSTLARALQQNGWDVANEPVSLELEHSAQSIGVKAFQEQIVRARAKLIRSSAADPALILDRSLEEDAFVFFQLHHRIGNLTSVEVDQLRAMDVLHDSSLRCAAYICMSATPDVLAERLVRREAPAWLIDSIGLQWELYNDWFESVYESSTLLIDTRHVGRDETVARVVAALNARMKDGE